MGPEARAEGHFSVMAPAQCGWLSRKAEGSWHEAEAAPIPSLPALLFLGVQPDHTSHPSWRLVKSGLPVRLSFPSFPVPRSLCVLGVVREELR